MIKSKHPKNDSVSTKLTRRQILKSTASAGALLIAPTIIPATVLGKDGAVPPSERIILGGIGIGGRGTFDLRMLLREPDVQCVAACDPQKSRLDATKNVIDSRYENSDCQTYRDIREFLALRTDIDAVLITTGDRWHAFDPRNNAPRVGRILIAHGRDAADVPLTHIFGPGTLSDFQVWADEAPPK